MRWFSLSSFFCISQTLLILKKLYGNNFFMRCILSVWVQVIDRNIDFLPWTIDDVLCFNKKLWKKNAIYITCTYTPISSKPWVTYAFKVSSGICTCCILVAVMTSVAAFIKIWVKMIKHIIKDRLRFTYWKTMSEIFISQRVLRINGKNDFFQK